VPNKPALLIMGMGLIMGTGPIIGLDLIMGPDIISHFIRPFVYPGTGIFGGTDRDKSAFNFFL